MTITDDVINLFGGADNALLALLIISLLVGAFILVKGLTFFSTRHKLLLEVFIALVTFYAMQSYGALAILVGIIAFLLVNLPNELSSLLKSNHIEPDNNSNAENIPSYKPDGSANLDKIDMKLGINPNSRKRNRRNLKELVTKNFLIGLFFWFAMVFASFYILSVMA